MSVKTAELVKQQAPCLSVGVISADLMNLQRDIGVLEGCGTGLLHFDIMDGHFAPMLTVGPSFVKAVKTSMLKDVHLMVDEPLEVLDDYALAGADLITVHVESCRHPHRALQRVGELQNANDPERGIACGVGLNPSTGLHALEPLIDLVDFVLLVAVNPGFGGQKFIGQAGGRVADVRRMAKQRGGEILVGIDGGVTCGNIGEIAGLKPDFVVTGSAAFKGKGPKENTEEMNRALRG